MKARERMAWTLVFALVLGLLGYVSIGPAEDFTRQVKPQPIKFVGGIAFQKVPGLDRWERIE